MAEKGFGVKEINLIGASGTPTIESPNNLNLNAVNVAISTNVSIGGTLSVTGNVSVGGTLTYEDVTNIDSIGIITARSGVTVSSGNVTTPLINLTNNGLNLTSSHNIGVSADGLYVNNTSNNSTIASFQFSTGCQLRDTNGVVRLYTQTTGATVTGTLAATTFSGSGASLTNLPLPDVQVAYTVTANGSSAYRFAGNGVVSTADNPDLYLIRGQKYRFINNSGGSHPFQIRESSGGSAYSTGVTNNGAASGNIDFAPVFNSPGQLVYQCTSHGGMVGNIYISDGEYNTKPNNPVFMAYRTSNYATTTSATALVFNDKKIDVGGNYDHTNGRFTAPVTGLYEFAYASIASNTQTVYRYDLRINGSIPYSGLRQELRIDQNGQAAYGTNGEYCLYINMTQGQYAQVYVHSDSAVNTVYGDTSYGYTYFRGRLIG